MSSSLKPSIVPSGLAERIQSAIDRVTSGQATMRVPAEASDPDLVLGECRTLVQALASQAPPASAIRNQALDDAAKAVEQHEKTNRGWVNGSLWDTLTREASARILALKVLDVIDPVPAEYVKAWRCFHCDEFFTDAEHAREHFGSSEIQSPACTIDIAEYRSMEALHRRHCVEDTDLHREVYGLQSKHRSDLMREEEKGYARGLSDAVTPAHAKVINDLIALARETFHLLDNSEEREGDDGLELVVFRGDFDAVSSALDVLDGLPDDQPGVVMGPAAKAEWALRELHYRPLSAAQSTCGKGGGKNTPTPCLDSKARIVDGFLTIHVPVETLAFAAQNSDYFFDAAENGEALVVSDQSNFARSVAHALNVEAEDGSTPVTRMLDKATKWIAEQGEEGIDYAPAGTGSTP